jgi:mono/diheme cytochrome c family protein
LVSSDVEDHASARRLTLIVSPHTHLYGRNAMKNKGYLWFMVMLVTCGILAACSFFPSLFNNADVFFDQTHDQMPGPGMMRDWPNNMPGPGMMSQYTYPPPVVTPAPTATPGGSTMTSYSRDIQLIFDRACISCHGGQAGLYLESFDYLMAGSANGPVVVPDNPNDSELVKRIQGLRQPAMPLGDVSLSSSEVEAIILWIDAGSPNN